MGGSGTNRYDPEVDHWSLAVKDGKVLEKGWRTEIPIPRGGPHRYMLPHFFVKFVETSGIYFIDHHPIILCLSSVIDL